VDRIKQAFEFRQGMYDPQPKAKLYIMRRAARLTRSVNNITWTQFNASIGDDLVDALRYAVMDLYHVRSLEPPKVTFKPIVLGGRYAS
jgi:hypothetical protein